ncbi:MAG: MarR family transcriptional regulator [Chloroflexota bacterium]
MAEKNPLFQSRLLHTWVVFKQTHDLMVKLRNQELRRYGLNLEYAATLSLVPILRKKATPGEIARWRYRRPHTISKLLKYMEADGLIERTSDSQRRNVIHVTFTDKGRKAHQRAKGTIKSIKRMFSALSEDELECFLRYLEVLRAKAEEHFASMYEVKPIHEQFIDGETEYNTWRVLRTVNDVLDRLIEHKLSKEGFSSNMVWVLRVISMLGKDASPGSTATWRLRSPNTISDFLIRMERKGLVARKTDPEKRSHLMVKLTPKGQRYLRQATMIKPLKHVLETLTYQELDDFRRLLMKLRVRVIQELAPKERTKLLSLPLDLAI